jgi:hypothetical protein
MKTAGTPQGIYRSTNGGASFTKVSGAIAGVRCIVADSNSPGLLYLGTSSMGVYTSADGGTTWSPYNDGLANSCVNCLALASGQYLYAGTHGSAGFRHSLSVGTDDTEEAFLQGFTISVSPNPTSGTATALFECPEPGQASLEVFDLSGRLVAVPVSEYLEAGTHEVLWDGRLASGRQAPGGVYLVRLTVGDLQGSARLVLAR